jgi:chemotaxis protein CheD
VPRSAAKTSPGPVPGRISPDVGSRAQVYLHPGQLAVASKPTAITTVLGSCVAVCIHDPVAGVGGMNHFLLPHHVERERSARFGTVAIPDLVSAVLRAGAKRVSLVAKVFGGANALAGVPTGRRLGGERSARAPPARGRGSRSSTGRRREPGGRSSTSSTRARHGAPPLMPSRACDERYEIDCEALLTTFLAEAEEIRRMNRGSSPEARPGDDGSSTRLPRRLHREGLRVLVAFDVVRDRARPGDVPSGSARERSR